MPTKIVDVDLDELIDLNREGFLDLLEDLWMADYDEEHRGILADIRHRALGVNPANGLLQIEVTAQEECMLDDDDEPQLHLDLDPTVGEKETR